LKRFLAFSGDYDSNKGGWDDFCGDFDSIEEAEQYLRIMNAFFDWFQIVDTEKLETVVGGPIRGILGRAIRKANPRVR
jgi:hypothetical protein